MVFLVAPSGSVIKSKTAMLPFSIFMKMKIYAFIVGIVIVSHFSISSCELVTYMPCGDTNSGVQGSCEISNVTIDPCPEAADQAATCNAYRENNMTINFDWIPPFSSANYTSAIYSSTLVVDIPDIDHDRPGCRYSKCPIVAGERNTFKATRFVKPIYPAGPYLVKYRLFTESSKKECCFLVNVNIV